MQTIEKSATRTTVGGLKRSVPHHENILELPKDLNLLLEKFIALETVCLYHRRGKRRIEWNQSFRESIQDQCLRRPWEFKKADMEMIMGIVEDFYDIELIRQPNLKYKHFVRPIYEEIGPIQNVPVVDGGFTPESSPSRRRGDGSKETSRLQANRSQAAPQLAIRLVDERNERFRGHLLVMVKDKFEQWLVDHPDYPPPGIDIKRLRTYPADFWSHVEKKENAPVVPRKSFPVPEQQRVLLAQKQLEKIKTPQKVSNVVKQALKDASAREGIVLPMDREDPRDSAVSPRMLQSVREKEMERLEQDKNSQVQEEELQKEVSALFMLIPMIASLLGRKRALKFDEVQSGVASTMYPTAPKSAVADVGKQLETLVSLFGDRFDRYKSRDGEVYFKIKLAPRQDPTSFWDAFTERELRGRIKGANSRRP